MHDRRTSSARRARPPRAVLLDVGETLLGPRESFGDSYARVFAELGIHEEREAFGAAMRAAWIEMSERHPPGVDRYGLHDGGDQAFWTSFAGRVAEVVCDGACDRELVEAAVARLREHFAQPSGWRVYDDVPGVLDALRAKGARLAVVSNWDSRLPTLLERLGLADAFEHVEVSHLAGCEKPAPEIFRRALRALGVAPHETLHVGDIPELDLAGARLAGVPARLVDRHGRLDPLWNPMPTLEPLVALYE